MKYRIGYLLNGVSCDICDSVYKLKIKDDCMRVERYLIIIENSRFKLKIQDFTPSIDRTLHQFLSLLPNLTFNLIVQGFHRTFATGAACQQRTLTSPDTYSCPTLGLACVLMSRPISPELVLYPDFSVSNIPRYFSFAPNNSIECYTIHKRFTKGLV